jgi:ADP-heptose:LPS heptosyltransferase
VATHWVTSAPDGTHQVDRCLRLLAAVGIPQPDPHPRLRVPPRVRRDAEVRLRAAAAVVLAAAVTVSNNSPVMHLADALGTAVVVAWSGTEHPGEVGPRAVPSALLSRPVPCAPCHQSSCPDNHECLDLDPAALAAAALRLAGMSTSRPPGPSAAAPEARSRPEATAAPPRRRLRQVDQRN